MKKLNLGCGKDVRKGWVNLDAAKLPGVDVVHDFDKAPLPFRQNEFDEVLCQDVLEHADDVLAVLGEIHRILKPGGIARIRVPHFTSAAAFNDLTHRHLFAWDSFTYLEKASPYHFYVNFSFRQAGRKLVFGKRFAVWNWIIEPLANLFPRLYEDTPLRVFPALNLQVVLRKS